MNPDNLKPPMRIALFDSGVGGLSVLRQLAARTHGSRTRFVYLADTLRCPYGNRDAAEIAEFVQQITHWLADLGVDRIVMACNTSAAVAGLRARQSINVPLHDIITPSAYYCSQNHRRVAVLATATTCKSRAFSKAISGSNPDTQVLESPCPDLVPLVEAGIFAGEEVEKTIAPYVKQIKDGNCDAAILGCTHFPFLEAAFRKLLPDTVELVDPAEHLSLSVLGKAALVETSPEHYAKQTYFTTGNAEQFAAAAERCLQLPQSVLNQSVCSIAVSDLEAAGTFNATPASTVTGDISKVHQLKGGSTAPTAQ